MTLHLMLHAILYGYNSNACGKLMHVKNWFYSAACERHTSTRIETTCYLGCSIMQPGHMIFHDFPILFNDWTCQASS